MRQGENITITVSGANGSGKSAFAQIIVMQLIERGISVNMHLDSEGRFSCFRDSNTMEQIMRSFYEHQGTVKVLEVSTVGDSDEVGSAKELLRAEGYFVDNLWNVDDVRAAMEDEDVRYLELTDSQCMDILKGTVDSDYTKQEINSSIKTYINDFKIKR